MPRKASTAGQTRDQLFRIAQTLGYNKTAFSRTTGLSYWKSRQLVDKLKARKPINDVLGKRNPEKRLAELQAAVTRSGYDTEHHQRIRAKGIDRKIAIPPDPNTGTEYMKKLSSKKFKKQGVTRSTYKFEPGKRINISPTDTVYIVAKGKGKSAGKSIKRLASPAGDWAMAWAQWMYYAKTTNFTASSFEVVVIR